MLMMNRCGFGIAGMAAPAVGLAAWAVIVICGPPAASAAELTVLCEEFTNLG